MMQGQQNPDSVSPLSRMVEQLALDVVMTTGPVESQAAHIAEALVAIQEQAQAAGCSDALAILSDLLPKVESAVTQALEWTVVEDCLHSSLEQLQAAVASGGAITAPQPQATPASFLALSEDPELLNDFILETSEHLASIESQLLTLEHEPQNTEAIHAVFRSFHTVKGLAGFLELQEIREVAHEVETVLDQARNGQLTVTPAVIDTVLASGDFLKSWVELLQSRLAGDTREAPPSGGLLVQIRKHLTVAGDAAGNTPIVETPHPNATSPREGPRPPAAPPPDHSSAGVPAVELPLTESTRKRAIEARTVKVDTGKLDALVDMVGEMVIAQSLVRHDPDLAGLRTPRLLRNLSQLARTTDELQKTAMSMRMVPVGQLFQKMTRLTRDLARKSGKQAEMETSGEETELDRHLVEELADPMMHMVRNAVDHGLESATERTAAGKAATGKVRLRACHQAGHIVIELSDDGRGLNREKIVAKAREKGLIDNSASLTDSEVNNLIFRPGFSTAEKVTDVSGRGVGMDVVRKQIQKLRGRIEIVSKPGAGSTFILKLPLTLAIIDGLVVRVGVERYIVPLFSVREVLRPTADMMSTVENRAEVALVRDRLLPVMRLCERFGVQARSEDPCEGVLVISESGGRVFGLLVDELIGKQEVVIKNLGETLKNIPGVAGGAILGDGRVGLVLDMDGVLGARDAVVRA